MLSLFFRDNLQVIFSLRVLKVVQFYHKQIENKNGWRFKYYFLEFFHFYISDVPLRLIRLIENK